MRSFFKHYMGIGLLLGMFLSSCNSLFYQPVDPAPARIGEETFHSLELKNLPDPTEKIVIAVYKFRDQSGQYKPTENGTSWSTAVTQGATSILIKALEDSGWFIPIERENVGNLLNERKIIRSSRAQFNAQNGNNSQQNLLPPLLYAGVILEGGIVSYDANVVTGGAGLRYFGVGGSTQYRQDRVTVYLRAISTANGKVLKTVYTTKTILSQAMDGGLFQFVRFRRLFEAETGFSYNEPAELAVRDAIEKGVLSMVVEGIEEGLWNLADDAEMEDNSSIKAYKDEKNLVPKTNAFGKRIDNRRAKFALQAASSSLLYKGDFPDPLLKTGAEIGLAISPNPMVGIHFQYGLSGFSTQKFYESRVSYLEVGTSYRFFPYDSFTPYITAGLGFITENLNGRFDYGNNFFAKGQFGLGAEYLVNKNIGIRAGLDYNVLFSDGFDHMEQGKFNDLYWRGNLGINFYFGQSLEGKRKFEYKKESLDDGF